MEPEVAAVVGGGIAGLSAAAHLAERGVPVLLLEQNPYSFGGRVCAHPPTSFSWNGATFRFTMEHGMHGWWRQYRNFHAFLDRLALSQALVPAIDQALIYRDANSLYRVNVGRRTQVTRIPEPFHHLPLFGEPTFRRLLRGKEMLRLPTLAARVARILAFDPYDPKQRATYDVQSVQDFLPGMPLIFKAFLRSLSRSGFFSDPPEVSLWAFLLSLQLYVFLRKEDQCFHFMRGNVADEFANPVVARIRAAGGAAVRGVTVTDVRALEGGGFELEVDRDPAADAADVAPDGPTAGPVAGLAGALAAGRLRVADVVVAVDVRGAQDLAARSAVVREAVGEIGVFRGRRSTNVRLWWATAPELTYAESGVFAGKFAADNYFWLHRIQDEFRRFHEATGGACSESHVYAPESMHELSDETLIERVRADVEAAFPEVAGTCIHAQVVRNPPTHINFPVGCAQSFPTVEGDRADLALAGDWVDGGAPVLYMERACQTGIAAANVLLRRRGAPPFEVLLPEDAPGHMRALQRVLRGGRGGQKHKGDPAAPAPLQRSPDDAPPDDDPPVQFWM